MAQTVLISTVQGITANRLRKTAKDNKRLRILTEQMRLAHEHKDKFLSHVNHEMRTPLNVINGYLSLLQTREDLPPDTREQIEQLCSASTHMLSLVNDLLDYSQIHQGQFTLAIQPVELPTLINQAFGTFQHQARQKNLEFICTQSPTLPRWVHTDPTRLTQILLNLLGNAIKFTFQGQVRLDVSSSPHAQTGNPMMHIIVSDTGPGIPAAVLNKIYAPFYQLHPPQTLQNGNALHGNGLGLAITQGLVKNWQGNIEVSSTLGKGSTFHVSIPMSAINPVAAFAGPQTKAAAAAAAALMPLRILVVDDHAMNRMVASATIRKHLPDCRIDQAENGQQALQKMASELYDVVLLDIVMPDLSGIEVLQAVRQTYPEPYRNVRTIAFTANVEADIKAECERTGFDGFLSKPFNVHTLMQMLKPVDPDNPFHFQHHESHLA
jgi:signal transduction histidine kinase/CheY-like chemotaxis protein